MFAMMVTETFGAVASGVVIETSVVMIEASEMVSGSSTLNIGTAWRVLGVWILKLKLMLMLVLMRSGSLLLCGLDKSAFMGVAGSKIWWVGPGKLVVI